MDFAGAVPVMDLAGDPGQPFVRQPQVRLTHNPLVKAISSL